MNSIWLAIFLPAIITTPCCDSIASFNRALTIAFVAICLLLIKDWVIVQMQSTLAHSVVREKPKRQLITRQQSPKRWLNHRKKMDIPSLNLKNISASPGRAKQWKTDNQRRGMVSLPSIWLVSCVPNNPGAKANYNYQWGPGWSVPYLFFVTINRG